jgi:hypothetical protein
MPAKFTKTSLNHCAERGMGCGGIFAFTGIGGCLTTRTREGVRRKRRLSRRLALFRESKSRIDRSLVGFSGMVRASKFLHQRI